MAERKRQLVRDELADAALRLLARQGFDSTTVEEIVAAAGVSRRTFFRYFQSKEDVIVQMLTDTGAELCAALRSRPAGEPPAVAVRQAFTAFLDKTGEDRDKTLRLTQLMLGSPALLARFLERQAQWQADIAEVLAGRSSGERRDLHAAIAAGVALTAFNTALTRWAAVGGAEDLAGLIDETFAVVAPALDAAR